MVWCALAHRERLLHLRRRLVVVVAGLVGVDDAGAGTDEGDRRARDRAYDAAEASIVNVTVRPEVAVAVTL